MISMKVLFMISMHESTSSSSHECILLPSCIYNMHQDTKSAQLIAVCKRTLRKRVKEKRGTIRFRQFQTTGFAGTNPEGRSAKEN